MKIRKLFHKKKSSDIAKDRLKILLISDRVNCSPEIMNMMKNDIANVLSKYMKIDSESMEIQITKKGNHKRGRKSPFLYVNIPDTKYMINIAISTILLLNFLFFSLTIIISFLTNAITLVMQPLYAPNNI